MQTKWVFVLGISLLFLACNKASMEIREYEVLAPSSSSSSSETLPAFIRAQVKWLTPAGWREKPASGMRLASFVLETDLEAQHSPEISLVSLAGDAGGLVANVNRWREQLSLAPMSGLEIQQTVKKDHSQLGAFEWVHFSANQEPSANAMIAALFFDEKTSTTLFLKMQGSKKQLEYYQNDFLSLCRSLRK